MFALPPRHSSRRGQALVEMAIILPLLALFLVMAIDAGRLFFGWVALHNASRIGADYAAVHADAWDGAPNPIEQNQQDRYVDLVQADLQALGCQGDPVPDPNFDPDGDGTSVFTDGSPVRVELACDFSPLTPLAESFLGQPLKLHARSDFAINRTLGSGAPPPVNPPPPVGCPSGQAMVPPLIDERNQDAYALWVGRGFNGANYSPQVTNSNKNKKVKTQSLPADSCQPLTAPMGVTL